MLFRRYCNNRGNVRDLRCHKHVGRWLLRLIAFRFIRIHLTPSVADWIRELHGHPEWMQARRGNELPRDRSRRSKEGKKIGKREKLKPLCAASSSSAPILCDFPYTANKSVTRSSIGIFPAAVRRRSPGLLTPPDSIAEDRLRRSASLHFQVSKNFRYFRPPRCLCSVQSGGALTERLIRLFAKYEIANHRWSDELSLGRLR